MRVYILRLFTCLWSCLSHPVPRELPDAGGSPNFGIGETTSPFCSIESRLETSLQEEELHLQIWNPKGVWLEESHRKRLLIATDGKSQTAG